VVTGAGGIILSFDAAGADFTLAIRCPVDRCVTNRNGHHRIRAADPVSDAIVIFIISAAPSTRGPDTQVVEALVGAMEPRTIARFIDLDSKRDRPERVVKNPPHVSTGQRCPMISRRIMGALSMIISLADKRAMPRLGHKPKHGRSRSRFLKSMAVAHKNAQYPQQVMIQGQSHSPPLYPSARITAWRLFWGLLQQSR